MESMSIKEKTKKKKFKIKKKWLIIGGIILVVAIVLLIGLNKSRAEQSGLTFSDTTVLSLSDIQDTVNATGTVESASSMTVYSTLAYTVKAVNVEVGDYVEKGALLAELDGDAIADQIESQEAAIGVSSNASAEQIKSAQDNYDAAKYALENGLNAAIISAESQVQITYDNYLATQENYARYEDGLDEGENSSLLSAQAARNTAKMNLESAKDAYDLAKDAYDAAKLARDNKQSELDEAKDERDALLAAVPPGDTTAINAEITTLTAELAALQATLDTAQRQLDSAERALDYAKDSYDIAKAQYDAVAGSVDNALDDYATAMDNAYKSYQTALANLAAARESAQNQLQSYLNALNNTKASTDNTTSLVSLRHLRADLASTKITAPVSGTITAVYAQVGGGGSGLLFVIEDVNNLVVETSVKEYDIATVKPGMAVTIKSDATGDDVFNGTITSIAPTSTKNNLGETQTASDALFATEVTVMSADTGLKIGMSVRLNYIIAEQKNVLTVPYDAVYENSEGQSCVLTASEQNDGKYLLSELPVETGIGNDLDIVISGEGVQEGLRIVNEPEDYLAMVGKPVSISEMQAAPQNNSAPMMGGF